MKIDPQKIDPQNFSNRITSSSPSNKTDELQGLFNSVKVAEPGVFDPTETSPKSMVNNAKIIPPGGKSLNNIVGRF